MNEIIMGKCEVYSSLILFQVLICPNQKIDTRVQTTKKWPLDSKEHVNTIINAIYLSTIHTYIRIYSNRNPKTL